MHCTTIQPQTSISLFVKNILLFEEQHKTNGTTLPFFADGYPGIMFQDCKKGLTVQPHNKKMPELFLYGQTIHPIELQLSGNYQLIVFQLYPFIVKSFFGLSAASLNDDCYDLEQVSVAGNILRDLTATKQPEQRIEIIAAFLLSVFDTKKQLLDFDIRKAIQVILDHKGQMPIEEVCRKIHLTKKTLERRFLSETGILPKQFSTITRFQQSLEQLTLKDFNKLTDIVYNNGFADQSHFIRVFKAFTGKTPKNFTKKR